MEKTLPVQLIIKDDLGYNFSPFPSFILRSEETKEKLLTESFIEQ